MTDATTSTDARAGQFCPRCGYDLRGATSDRCSECGLPLDGLDVSPIPWAHRARLGRWRAFWATVRTAGLRPRRLTAAAAGPVDARAAAAFRACAVGVGTAAVTAVVYAVSAIVGGSGWVDVMWIDPLLPWLGPTRSPAGTTPCAPTDATILWSAGASRWAVVPVAVAATLWAWTGLAGWIVGLGGADADRRGRARAVGWYAATGPLALLPGPSAAAVAAVWMGRRDAVSHPPLWTLFSLDLLIGGGVLAWLAWAAWWAPVRAAYLAGGRPRLLPAVASGAGLLAAAAVAAVVGCGLVPCVAGLVWIVVDSLRR